MGYQGVHAASVVRRARDTAKAGHVKHQEFIGVLGRVGFAVCVFDYVRPMRPPFHVFGAALQGLRVVNFRSSSGSS